jgi:ankyrin repeat protein
MYNPNFPKEKIMEKEIIVVPENDTDLIKYTYITAEELLKMIKNGLDVKEKNCLQTTSLMAAAYKNPDPDVIRVLAAHGVDVNARAFLGTSALEFAAVHNNSKVISVLIELGAEVNPPQTPDPENRSYPSTPLINAVKNNTDAEVTRILLEAGAKINVGEGFDERLPLSFAKKNGNPKVLRFLENFIWKQKKQEMGYPDISPFSVRDIK